MTGAASAREGFAAFMLRMRARGVRSSELFAAMEVTPRASFVPVDWHRWTWSKGSIPIDCGEAIESADLQATVLDALEVTQGNRVLEIGTGSGYTAAVLSHLAERVVSLDRYRTLVEDARIRHEALGLKNITTHQADGSNGVEDSPFDRIVVWAAFEEPPRRFVEFLTNGGVLVAPVGAAEDVQMFHKFVKTGSRFERTDVVPARLLPLGKGVAQAL